MSHKVTDKMINKIISLEFRSAFDVGCPECKDRIKDCSRIGDRLQNAREAASKLVPPGRTGMFDDETLTFKVDSVKL